MLDMYGFFFLFLCLLEKWTFLDDFNGMAFITLFLLPRHFFEFATKKCEIHLPHELHILVYRLLDFELCENVRLPFYTFYALKHSCWKLSNWIQCCGEKKDLENSKRNQSLFGTKTVYCLKQFVLFNKCPILMHLVTLLNAMGS